MEKLWSDDLGGWMSTTTEGKDDSGNGSMLSIDFLSLSLSLSLWGLCGTMGRVWFGKTSGLWGDIRKKNIFKIKY